jgi:hypothetical protein
MPAKKSVIKKASPKSTRKHQKTPGPDIQILAVETCPSVSGSSTLKYQIGMAADSGIHLKVLSSSGSGFVNPTWFTLDGILNILVSHSVNLPIKSSHIAKGLELEGRSRNDAAFLIAVLAANEVLVPFGGQDKFQWKYASADEFLARCEKLKAGNASKPSRKKTA